MLPGRGRGSFQSRGGGRHAGGSNHGRGGAAATAHKSAPARVKRSVVPAFPVVSRGGEPAEPTTPSARLASLQRAQKRQEQQGRRSTHDDGGDDAPPVAVSARRGPAAASEGESGGFIPPGSQKQQRGRGRGVDRVGHGRFNESGGARGRGGEGGLRRDRGGFGGGVSASSACAFSSRGRGRGRGGSPYSPHRGGHDSSASHHGEEEHDSNEEAGFDSNTAKSGPRTRVITTVTANGTELPKKLNTKVFVDGLPYTYAAEPGKPTLEEEVLQFASAWKVGKPLRLIKKPGQGFGFLVLQSPNSVSTAVRVLNGRKFLGRTLRVEEPKPKDLERTKDIGGMKDLGKDSFTRQVLLTDLAKVTQPEIIREVLRDVAPQLEKKLEAIKMTSQNRKAFLTFATEAEVTPAITFLDGFHLLGRRISATKAAAPGSLPYSHGATRTPRAAGGLAGKSTAVASPAASGSAAAEADDEEELTVMPLGLEPSKVASAAARRCSRAENVSASATGTGSNVTGRTEKYNLLDDGPKDIYVGNVGEDVTEATLRQHFAPCGAIRKCEILVHPETHLSTGIAHIEFALPAYAAYAQERYHGSRLRGCVLRVDRGETASAPLVAELPPEEAEEDYDEDAYMERYGVKDKRKYFKGTSVAAEMGADPNVDDDDDSSDIEDALTGRAKNASSQKNGKRERVDAKAPAREPAAAAKRQRTEAPESRGKPLTAAVAANDSDDDDDEEHFFDADTVAVAGAGVSSHASCKRTVRKIAADKGRFGKGNHKKAKKR
ncbi:Triple RNA binding domain protein 3 [Leishmania donovani]|uniref:Triple_RNA_binding_domain_protein_3 n=3 Tax=Leishmania donovani species complex TaxID=38574 RepID=A0A6L0XTG8_LEIIN|nr:putative RNA-binding protein [Leishmania infantum JPCM5]CAC9507475.1 Triple_RNA_binding_domain_protein_3 [Leishmania infantum]CAJ1990538.1 Triple RNA binding domain protein 3 [Leishmania donovani]CAM69629.2 putative RNA-binding protein [Leishmania infantum JPCM5]SUZ43567.1 Triple_RNA_binding_domain_protein_3 [Leishmania infantum]VDZ46393.1 Triple_RNA_binding_domain_protein_3/GeneDB:LmjF.29.0680 [Leishmania donovani]|eukprot:XP_001466590.2 putative RNA-binding protein [Leishmania infantum JPCM5]